MTSNQQQLAKLEQHAKALAEQIKQLQDQLNNAEPTTGLLGRWATNRDGKQVLITADTPSGGWIETAFVSPDGTTSEKAEQFDSLIFPEQTTRPEDVPVGEAWLVNADDGDESATNAPAVKGYEGLWVTGEDGKGGTSTWRDNDVTLITPLIPARPQDSPETVTTLEEYGALPEGSVVAKPGENPWVHLPYMWVQSGATTNDMALAGTTRGVLRRGWGAQSR
ncbi:hypothetical protein ACKFRT_04415 [Corynebacterium sp. YSMAA1_1_F7]|uniref:hypothetical protein n=1 Tax=Corynebacterium sp. YSMAA1_1_F7 TaxID=3383590 RepID=UPI0038D20F29